LGKLTNSQNDRQTISLYSRTKTAPVSQEPEQQSQSQEPEPAANKTPE